MLVGLQIVSAEVGMTESVTRALLVGLLAETVEVELPHEGEVVGVLEVLREDVVSEVGNVLDVKGLSVLRPPNRIGVVGVLSGGRSTSMMR